MGHTLLAISEGMVPGQRQWEERGAWSEGGGLRVPCGMVTVVVGCVGFKGGRGMLAEKEKGEEEGGAARASGREWRERRRTVSTLLKRIENGGGRRLGEVRKVTPEYKKKKTKKNYAKF